VVVVEGLRSGRGSSFAWRRKRRKVEIERRGRSRGRSDEK